MSSNYVPQQNEKRHTYCLHWRSFMSTFYIVNQWVDAGQTHTRTSLGCGTEVVIRFDDLDLFQSQRRHSNFKY